MGFDCVSDCISEKLGLIENPIISPYCLIVYICVCKSIVSAGKTCTERYN